MKEFAVIRIGVGEGSQELAEAIKAGSPGAVVRAPMGENRFYEVVSPKRLRIKKAAFDALAIKPLSWPGLLAARVGYLVGYNSNEIIIEARRPKGLSDAEATELCYMHTPTIIGGVLAARAQAARAAEAPLAQPAGPVRRFPAMAQAQGITQPCWYQIENPATGSFEWRHSDGSVSRQTAQRIVLQEARQKKLERTGAALAEQQAQTAINRQQRQADRIRGAIARTQRGKRGRGDDGGGEFTITVEDGHSGGRLHRTVYGDRPKRRR